MDDEEVLVDPWEIRIADHPLAGREIRPDWVERAALPEGSEANGIQNWDYFDGAIVGVGVADPKRLVIYGSGVMVAPGVVLTASHNINEHYDAVKAGKEQIHCIAVRQGGRAELWTLRRWKWPETKSDISILNVEVWTAVPEDWTCGCLPISTRAPQIGENLSVSAFDSTCRIGAVASERSGTPPSSPRGGLYVSTGQVQKLWYPQRDPKRISFPAIEIGCDALDGMSGGPVLDKAGDVVGILSASMETLEGKETYAAWILQAFTFKLGLVWPPGLYPEEATLLDLPDTLINIIGRDKVRSTGELDIGYECWH